LRALRRNKLRTLLTMLVSSSRRLGHHGGQHHDGRNQAGGRSRRSLGQNVITVFSGNFTSGGVRGGWGGAPTLTIEDAMAIKNEISTVVAVSPSARPQSSACQRPQLEHPGDRRRPGLIRRSAVEP